MSSRRIAIVDKQKCDPSRCAKECMIYDPVNRSGGQGFHLGPDRKATIAEEVTTEAHQICAKKCPFDAIKIIRLPEEAKGPPIHRYGEVGFRLYNLPIPIFGKVVGLVGRNGIGKSTAVKILSGILNANLGDTKKKPDESTIAELIQRFKGSVAQQYFERMRDGKITVAYKPQPINLIPQQFKGKVSALLKQVSNDTEKIKTIVEKLQLTKILDHNIDTVSGGELQRIAIAATMLKPANVYIFDEPSSFLDIKQRLRCAQIIRELATEDTAVMVIEHDLIILDYMSDFVHIIYGEDGAYGIVSQVKSTKAGINTYLEGYLREENIRFRDKPIQFYTRVEKDDRMQPTLTAWTKMTKKLGSFSLSVNEGTVKRHDVIGILGENGIGKSTFAKILAGVEQADSGEIEKHITISYKPQQIDTKSEELVKDVLKTAQQLYETQLIKPLNLARFYNQKLCDLSGGQLQTVLIAHCLSQDADMYLLDEPSAYLDTEQRLLISKIIKDWMLEKEKTGLIIDHDLLFVDYISDKLLVFEGVPAIRGDVNGPFNLQDGMNLFLKDVGLTFRRDEQTHRPRANKTDSQMDQKQKSQNKWYYV